MSQTGTQSGFLPDAQPVFAGLNPNATYYAQAAAYSIDAGTWTAFTNLGSTSTLAVAPASPVPQSTFSAVLSSSFTLNWSSGTAAAGYDASGTLYVAQISTMASFIPVFASSQTYNLNAGFTGLSDNVTYYAEVEAVNNDSVPTGFTNFGSTPTLAELPAPPAGSTFTAVAATGLTLNWSSGTAGTGYSPSGTAYIAQVSTMATFVPLAASSQTFNLHAAFTGLSANDTYYAQVEALNSAGTPTPFVGFGSTQTFAVVPATPVGLSTFTAVSPSGLTLNWSSGTAVTGYNAAGTLYNAQISLAASFTPILASSQTYNLNAAFAGLGGNVTYYAEVQAVDSEGGTTAFVNFGSTVAPAAAPAQAASTFTAVSAAGLTVNWSANGDTAGTEYYAQISLSPTFAQIQASSQTFNLSAAFAGLTLDTTYYAQAAAYNLDTSTWTAFTNLGSTSTLAVPPSAPIGVSTFSSVFASSFTLNWSSGTAGTGYDPAGTLYLAEISTVASFNPPAASSQTYNLNAGFTSLFGGVTYYAQVEALDSVGAASAFYNMGSTLTGGGSIMPEAYTGVTTAALTANWFSSFAPGIFFYTQLSTGAFPNSFTGNLSSNTFNLFAGYSGLNINTTYYTEISTSVASGPYTNLGIIATLAVVPAAPVNSSTITALSAAGLTLNWSSGTAGTGYNPAGTLYLAEISTMAGFVPLTASSQTYNLNAAFAGLNSDATFYLQVEALNGGGVPTSFVSFGSTATIAAPPGVGAPAFAAVSAAGLTVNWIANGDELGTQYYAQLSTMPGFVPILASSQTYNLNAAFTGLNPNATYYAQAAAYSIDAGTWTAFANLGSTGTLAVAPAAPASSTFTGVSANGFSVNWSSGTGASGYNSAGTLYVAQISTMASFAPVLASSQTYNLNAAFAGLSGNVTYYAQVQAVDGGGAPTAFTNFGSTATLAVVPAAPLPVGSSTFTAVAAASLTLNWSSGTAAGYDPAGTFYLAQVSTMASFIPVASSSQTRNLNAALGGLNPDTTYYSQVEAINSGGTPTAFVNFGSTATLAVAPAAPSGVSTFTAVSPTGLTLNWSSGTAAGYDPPGTVYVAQISTMAAFVPILASSQTYNLNAAFAGLTGDVTYYAEVQAVNSDGGATAFVNFGSTVAPAAPPGSAALPFAAVSALGLSVNWTANGNTAGTEYYAQISASAGFVPIRASSQTFNLDAAFAGLNPNTTYYAQAAAYNIDTSTWTAFTNIGSTSTLAVTPFSPLGVSTFSSVFSSSLTISWSSGTPATGYNAAGTLYLAQISSVASFVPLTASSQTYNLAATFTGLVGGVTYYSEVEAVNNGGAASAFDNLGSTVTTPSLITPTGFTGVTSTSMTVNWLSSFPSGDLFYTQLSSGPFPNSFSGNLSSNTFNLFAGFTGLNINTTYYAEISTAAAGGPYTSLGFTATLAVVPAATAGGSTFTAVTPAGLTLNWSSGAAVTGYNPAGTLYLAQISTVAGFSPILSSSQTYNLSAPFAGLSGNVTYYAQVQAINDGATPTAFVNFTSTVTPAASPGVPPLPLTAVSTGALTVNWTANGNVNGSEYDAQLSTMPGFVPILVSSQTYNLNASFAGLSLDTTYYAQAAAYNLDTSTWTAFTNLGSTSTLAVAPSAPIGTSTFIAVATEGLTLNWSSGTAVTGYNSATTLYVAQLSTMATFAPLAASSQTYNLDVVFLGLNPNAVYYAQVEAVNNESVQSVFTNFGSTATLSVLPAAPTGSSTFTAISPTSLTLNWSSGTAAGYDPSGTLYVAQISTMASFTPILSSSQTYNLHAAFATLSPDSTYYAQVQALNSGGTPTAFVNFGSTDTFAVLPAAPSGVSTFTAVSPTGLTLNWSSGTAAGYDPAGTLYVAQISTMAGFSPIFASSQTYNLNAAFAGLSGDVTYYAEVQAVNSDGAGTAFANFGSTVAPAAAPGVAAPAFAGVSTLGLTLDWTANGDTAGTEYYAHISTTAGFAPIKASSQTFNVDAVFASLVPNTTYYGQAAAYNIDTSTWTAFTNLGSTSTLAVAPEAPVGLSTFTSVFSSSFTLNWSSGTTGAGYNGAGTLYLAQVSSVATFTPLAASSQTTSLAATFTGLLGGVTYYAEIEAINNGGTASVFTNFGSTFTQAGTISPTGFSGVTSASMTVNWLSSFALGTFFYTQLSTGVLPNSFSGNFSSNTFNLSAGFTGLNVNTTYYAALSTAAAGGPYYSLGSTVTLAVVPAALLASSTFTGLSTTGLTLNWSSGTLNTGYDPAGTRYVAQISTMPGFVPLTASSQTYNLDASFAGLSSDATYYAQVEALNGGGTPTSFVNFGSTATIAASPGLAASTFTAVFAEGLTVNWTANGDEPGTQYYAQLSTTASFVPILASAQTNNLNTAFSGLSPNTTYYAQAAAYSIDAGTWTAFTNLGSTSTLAVGPVTPVGVSTFSAVLTTGLSVNWSSGTAGFGYNAAGTLYVAEVSTVATFVPLAASSQTYNLDAVFAGLNPNATYYAQVEAVNNNSVPTAFTNFGSTATLAVPPSAPAGSTFTAVSATGLTLNWSSGTAATGYDPSGTAYLAQLSTMASFVPLAVSSQTYNLHAAFAGLNPDATYYAQVAALNSGGTPTGFVSFGSTTTLAVLPAPPVGTSTFTAVSVAGLTLNWSSGTAATGYNAADTLYLAQISTMAGFNPVLASSETFGLNAAFTGLSGDVTYYAEVQAVNSDGTSTAFVNFGSTVTPAAAPGVAAPAFAAVSTLGLTVDWTANGNTPGVGYYAQISAAPGFAPIKASSQTYNFDAPFASLVPNTTYYAQAAAYNIDTSTWTAFTNLGSTSTLAVAPQSPVGLSTFSAVFSSSFTVSWSSGTAGTGYNAAGTQYLAQVSSVATFIPLAASSQTYNLGATITGLFGGVTYYVQVEAINNGGTPTAFTNFGSTLTGAGTITPTGFSGVTSGSATVNWMSSFALGTFYYAQLSTGPLPNGFSGNLSSNTFNLAAGFTGLNINTTYYADVSTAAAGGPYFTIGSTATLAVVPAALTSASTFSAVSPTGLTLNWSSGTAAGYDPAGTLYIAQISTMPGFVPLAASSQTYNLNAAFSGLAANDTYYAQAEALNSGGTPTGFVSFGSTVTSAASPALAAPAFASVSSTSLTVDWTSNGNAAGTQYYAQISTMAGFVPIFASSQTYSFNAAFAGLSPNVTYYAQAAAYSIDAGTWTAFTTLGSTATLAVPPAGLTSSSTFTAVAAAGLTLNWSSGTVATGYDAAGTLYIAQISTSAVFGTLTASSQTYNLNASFAGLNPNVTYYAEVQAVNDDSVPTAFANFGSTPTLAVPPGTTLGSSTFTAVSVAGLTLSWSSGTAGTGYDPAGTAYIAQVSTMATFLPLAAASQTYSLNAAFAGLNPDTVYYAQVQALNSGDTPSAFFNLGSTATVAVGPGAPAFPFTTVTAAALTANWTTDGDETGTQYYAQLSTAPDFSAITASSQTFNLNATFSGLNPNATYYAQAAAYSIDAGTWTAFTILGSTSTLAVVPGTTVGPSTFTAVFRSSFTANWSSGTAGTGYNPSGTLYVAQISSVSSFTPLLASSQTYGLSAGFTGLLGSVTYYVQVEAVNSDGVASAFDNLGSTITISGPPSVASPAFTSIASNGLTVNWLGNSPPLTTYYALISTAADFSAIAASSQTLNLSAAFASLNVNATYYAEAAAYDVASATWTSFTNLGSSSTLAVSPGQPVSTFTAVAGNAFTVNWTSGTAAGYDPAGTLYVAQISNVAGFVPLAASSQTYGLNAAFSGLSANDTYYAQVEALNSGGVATSFTGLGSTVTPVVAPDSVVGASTFTSISLTGLTVNWASGTAATGFNAAGTIYVVQISTMAGFSPLASSSQTYNLSVAFSGLISSTTYYAQVQSIGGNGAQTTFVSLGSTLTFGGVVGAGFTGLGSSSVTVDWASAFAQGTLYYTQLSSGAFPNAFSGNQSSNTFNLFAGFTGLLPDSTYYARTSTFPAGPYYTLSSTMTLSAIPGPQLGSTGFTGITVGGLTLSWSSGTSAGGYDPLNSTLYLAEVSTSAGFVPVAASSQTYNLSAAFPGLGPGATYYAQVQSISGGGTATAFANLGSTSTLAVVPGPTSSTFTAVTGNTITVNWSSGSTAGYNGSGASYLAEISTAAGFVPLAASSRTYNLNAGFSGLNPNISYYAQVQAVNGNGIATAFVNFGSTATPTAVPGAPAAVFSAMATTSVTVNWLSDNNPAGTTYYVQISTSANFSPILASSQTYNLSAAFVSLGVNTTYYAQAAAYSLNTSTWTAFINLGSSSTWANAPSLPALAQVAVSSIAISWSANGDPAWTNYNTQISTNNFATVQASTQNLGTSTTFFALAANATYYVEVQALNNDGVTTAFTVLPATWTAVAVPSSAAPAAVGSSSVTASWGADGNVATTRYVAQISTDNFATVNASSATFNLAAAFTGLQSNTTYYFHVEAIANNGLATAFTVLPATTTLLLPPALAFPGFTGVAAGAMTLDWANGGNGPGTIYNAEISTNNFATLDASSATLNLSALFGVGGQGPALVPNTTYYAQVQTISMSNDSVFVIIGSTSTLAVAPGPTASTFSAVTGNTLTVNWSSGSAAGYNSLSTLYLAEISTSPSFATLSNSSYTYNLNASFLDLDPNISYYAQVEAINNNGLATGFVNFGSTATPTAVPGLPAAPFTAVAYTSVTVNWLSDNNPAGTTYYAQISTSSNFSPILASSQTYALSAAFTGLSVNTTYYAQAAAYSLNTSTWTSFFNLGSTSTLANAPSLLALSQVDISSISVAWNANGDPAWTNYYAQISTNNFITVAASTQTLSTTTTFFSLVANATYYVEVQALNSDGVTTAFSILPATWTAVAGPSSAAPAAVGSSSVTASWGADGNAATTRYIAQISTDNFATVNASSATFNLSAAFMGLLSNTTYYFHVDAIGNNGQATGFTVLPATTTLLLPPALAVPGFTGVAAGAMTLDWANGGNGPGTIYNAEISTDNFATLDASSATLNLSALFGAGGQGPALAPNTTYYAQVQSLSGGGNSSAFITIGSTSTLAVAPGPTASTFTAVTGNTLTVNWSSGAAAGYNSLTTLYLAEISTSPSFATLSNSSFTYNLSASFLDLDPNISYYAQIEAINNNGIATGFVNFGSTATPTAVPGPPAAPFSAVAYTSVTVNWLSDNNPAGTTYYAQISTSASFSPILASSQTYALNAAFTGLSVNTTYYAQAAAYSLNTSTWTTFVNLGSTSTLANAPSLLTLAQVDASSISITWSANGDPAWTNYYARISTNNFATVLSSTWTLGTSTTFFSLVANATYYVDVQAVDNADVPTAFAALPATWTAVAAPLSAAPSAVGSSSVTANWGADGNAGTTLYVAQISTNSFASVNASSATFNAFAAFTGLLSNTTYYFHVEAVANGGQASGFTVLPTTTTLLLPPALAAQSFTSVAAGSVTIDWATGGNGPGTIYNAEISTNDFATLNASSATLNLSALFGAGGQGPALVPNTTYYAQVQTVSGSGAASVFVAIGSTSTLAASPSPAASTFTAVTGNTLTVNWSSGSASGYNPAGTLYLAEISTSPVFATLSNSSYTANLNASFLDLDPNVNYYARVQALNNNGIATAFVNFGSTATPTAVPGLPAAPFTAVAYTSVTVNWLSDNNPAGTTYYAQISTSASFSPILASSQTYALSAAFTGLSINATYYAQAAAYSLNTATWTVFANLGSTSTLAEAPGSLTLTQVGASSISVTWSANGDPASTSYYARLSTNNFATLVASSQTLNLSTTFFGLVANATYYVDVQAVDNADVGTAFASLPATWTAVAAPLSAAPTAVGSSSVTANWGADGNAGTTLYLAQISTSSFASINASSATFNASAVFTGLVSNTTYYFRVEAIGDGGLATAFTVLPTTATLLLPPATASPGFTAVATGGMTLNWATGGNGPGTIYNAEISTNNFATLNASSETLNLSAPFGAGGQGPALVPNTTYYAQVQAVSDNGSTSVFVLIGSTSTVAVAPSPTASTFTAVTGNTLTVNWSSGGAAGYNSLSTLYLAEISTSPSFATLSNSSYTYNLNASFLDLDPNTNYYAQVEAINNNDIPTGFVNFGSTATPTAVPGLPAAPFTAVAYTSVTVNWLSDNNPAGTTYYAQISTSASFSPILASSQTYALSATFTGLSINTTYYAQAAAYSLNAGTWTLFTNLGSTSTFAEPPASLMLTQIGVSSISVSWSANGDPASTSYYARLSTNNFATLVASSQTLNLSTTFFGLVANATYYVDVQALDEDDVATAFAALPATWTAVAAPLPAAPGVGSSSVTANWSADGNAGTTLYVAQISTDNFASVNASSATYNASAIFAGLTSNTTYYFRAEAIANNGLATAFTSLPSATTLLLPPSLAPPSFNAVTAASMTFDWGTGGNGPGTIYDAEISTNNFATLNASSATLNLSALFGAGGQGPALAPNTTYYAQVQAVNMGDASAFLSIGSTITLALPPTGTGVSTVTAASATISWSLGTNPAATVAQVQQSTDGVDFAAIYSGAVTSMADAGLLECTTYWVEVRNLNGAGLFTTFSNTAQFFTLGSTPSAAIGLSASAVSGNHVALNWTSSPSGDIVDYRLYYDAGTGTVNYGAPLAVLTSTQTAYTTGVLPSTATYIFALRAFNRCGVEDSSGTFASVGSTTTVSAVRAAITGPLSGKHVAGNAVSLIAGLVSGAPSQVGSILFQMRVTGTTAWYNVPSADAMHPNPATAMPYYLHWDVTGLTTNAYYDLRAVAVDISGSTDTSPSGITVVIDPVTPDISENNMSGQTQQVQTINCNVTNVFQVAGWGSDENVANITIPAGALTGSTMTVTITSNYAFTASPPAGLTVVGDAIQVLLSNGQSLLSSGLTAPITLSYVNGSAAPSTLSIYVYNPATGLWTQDFTSSVNTAMATVTGNTPHFSIFVVVAGGPTASNLDGVRVWPNPYKPDSPNPDEGRPYSFSDPNSASS